MSVNPYAATERHSPRSHDDDGQGCAVAYEARSMLIGDGERKGVFERLRELEHTMRIGIVLLALPIWIMLALNAWDRWAVQ